MFRLDDERWAARVGAALDGLAVGAAVELRVPFAARSRPLKGFDRVAVVSTFPYRSRPAGLWAVGSVESFKKAVVNDGHLGCPLARVRAVVADVELGVLAAVPTFDGAPVVAAPPRGQSPFQVDDEVMRAAFGVAASTVPAGGPAAAVRLRATLLGAPYEVVRVLDVPASFHLGGLHDVLQAAFGWADEHLHAFVIGAEQYEPSGSWTRASDETKLRLASLDVGSEFTYVYDFGDNWQVSIRVQETLPEPARAPAKLVTACGAPPPEDVGGTPGFAIFVDAMADPTHVDHEYRFAWHGAEFDPDDTAVGEVTERLQRIR